MGQVIPFRNIPFEDRHKYYCKASYSDSESDKFMKFAEKSKEEYLKMRKYDKKYEIVFSAKNYTAKQLANGTTLNNLDDILHRLYDIAYCKGVYAYRKHKKLIDKSCGW